MGTKSKVSKPNCEFGDTGIMNIEIVAALGEWNASSTNAKTIGIHGPLWRLAARLTAVFPMSHFVQCRLSKLTCLWNLVYKFRERLRLKSSI